MNPSATAKGLRALATRRDAQTRITHLTAFRIGPRWFHNGDCETLAPPDRRLPDPMTGARLIPPHGLTPLELIDDACDLERIAAKLETRN